MIVTLIVYIGNIRILTPRKQRLPVGKRGNWKLQIIREIPWGRTERKADSRKWNLQERARLSLQELEEGQKEEERKEEEERLATRPWWDG